MGVSPVFFFRRYGVCPLFLLDEGGDGSCVGWICGGERSSIFAGEGVPYWESDEEREINGIV